MRIRVGTAPDTTVYTFFQDPAGRLARMDKDGSVYRYFLWNGDDLYAELDSTGGMLTEYSWYPGMDRLHQFKDGATGYNVGTDAMGNVIVLTTSTGVYRTYEYSAYGDSVGGADGVGFGGRDRARFKGALYFPEVDLYYMRNRWYEPRTGRFLSEDPVGTGGSNRYVFANDDPVNGRDPTGDYTICYAENQNERECTESDRPFEVGGTGWEFGLGPLSSGFNGFGWEERRWPVISDLAHLSAVSVDAGQYLSQGQQVGLSGNTGCNETPPPCGYHLHWNVWLGGGVVDPLWALFSSGWGWRSPVNGAVEITGEYDEFRPGPRPSYHQGIDLAVGLGTPIYAPAAGTVLGAGPNACGGGFGICVRILHQVNWR